MIKRLVLTSLVLCLFGWYLSIYSIVNELIEKLQFKVLVIAFPCILVIVSIVTVLMLFITRMVYNDK